MMKPSTEKLQKVLARAGLGSRRTIEEWIRAGRVQVNRQTATVGDRVGTKDEIWVDGRRVHCFARKESACRILCYHKPVGEICTRDDPEGRTTVFEQLPSLRQGRWISIGRLDVNTSGLLLLTTDGELANRLMHPSQAIEREYAVRVLGEVNEDILKQLQTGVLLADGMARFNRILNAGGQGANHWYHVTLTEGRNREVKRLWESQGITVSRLIRIRFGVVRLPKGLRVGHYAPLDKHIEQLLLQQVGLAQTAADIPSNTAPHNKSHSRKTPQSHTKNIAR